MTLQYSDKDSSPFETSGARHKKYRSLAQVERPGEKQNLVST